MAVPVIHKLCLQEDCRFNDYLENTCTIIVLSMHIYLNGSACLYGLMDFISIVHHTCTLYKSYAKPNTVS